MKKLIFALFVTALVACAAPDAYTIKGDVKGLEGDVYLINMVTYEQDTVKAENGRFVFKGTIQNPALAFVRSEDGAFAENLFIEPGKIQVTGDAADRMKTQIGGTPTNEVLNVYNQKQAVLTQQFGEEPNEAAEEAYKALMIETVAANYNNLLGVSILALDLGYQLTASEVLAHIAKFTPELQQSEQLTELREQNEKKIATEPGNPYIDIVQNNAEGEPVSLKSVIENPKNKYVLVDFWASWCGPCMGEVPYLLKDYAEYGPKGFEIYGVSFDMDREKWLAAVADNKMNWVHVSDLNRFENAAAKDYAVFGIPSNFLIDCTTGKIVATNLRGEALGAKLKELLGE